MAHVGLQNTSQYISFGLTERGTVCIVAFTEQIYGIFAFPTGACYWAHMAGP